MKKLLTLVALGASAVTATFVSCQTSSKSSADPFAKADINHDGRLTAYEASDYFVTLIFTSRDLNHDGQLTWEEWNVPGAGQSRVRFNSADTNKDGNLSFGEALAYGHQRGLFRKNFEAADTNRDGYVTRDEAQTYAGSTEGPPR